MVYPLALWRIGRWAVDSQVRTCECFAVNHILLQIFYLYLILWCIIQNLSTAPSKPVVTGVTMCILVEDLIDCQLAQMFSKILRDHRFGLMGPSKPMLKFHSTLPYPSCLSNFAEIEIMRNNAKPLNRTH